jgi:hypothetical protein
MPVGLSGYVGWSMKPLCEIIMLSGAAPREHENKELMSRRAIPQSFYFQSSSFSCLTRPNADA